MNPMDMLPQWHRDAIAAGEAAEQREFEARQAERADRADTMARMAQAQENMVVYRTGHTSAELREVASNIAAAKEARNNQAEWGSAQRAAVFIDGRELQPIERARIGPLSRGVDTSLGGELARARQPDGREEMLKRVAELDRRQAALARAAGHGKPVISRSQTPDTITCTECIAENVTVDEYLELHHGQDPLPEVHVPDHAPQRSKRALCAHTSGRHLGGDRYECAECGAPAVRSPGRPVPMIYR